MRTFGFLSIIAFLLLFCSCAAKKQQESVFICTGAADDSYHSTPKCKELRNCDGEIGDVSLSDALEIGLHPCKQCFPKDSIEAFKKRYPGVMQ